MSALPRGRRDFQNSSIRAIHTCTGPPGRCGYLSQRTGVWTMSTKRIATVLIVAGSLIFTSLASAGPAVMCPAGAADHSTSDAVVCWNEIASEIVLGPQGVPAIISMAKIHGAIHDAVQAYEH